ncbi:MAG: hypothetical protein ACTSP2_04380 [Alphaproteobacteria bacterium]
MLGRSLLAIAVVAGTIGARPVMADEIADGIALLPGVVEDVRVGGTWSNDGQSGVYRIVIARSGGNELTARLFIQWVAFVADGGATLIDSLEITEFADLGVDIVDTISESDQDGLSVFIQADNPSPTGEDSFELYVFSPTDYLFDAATN